MKNIFKIFDKKTFLYTFFIWLNINISGIQKIYFDEGITPTVIIIKILHLFFLYFIFCKIHSLYVQRHESKTKNEIAISLIYFFILTILLILVWPGTWSSDDISVLLNAEHYVLTPWQHFFSGLFQILCLQTIPIPSGIIIIQIIISSLIVGYCITNISRLYGKNKKQVLIIQIILGLFLLFPPLIIYILSGFRMGMYSYVELLLITKMLILYKEPKKISLNDIIKISSMTIIVSCWRTEGIYYPVFILILFLILGKKVINRKVAIAIFGIVMVINFSIGKINNIMIDDIYINSSKMKHNDYNNPIMRSNNYSITATMEPVISILRISDESDKAEIDVIDKVLDVQAILEEKKASSERLFWTEGIVREYSDEEYYNYLKAYLKLALKYPDVTFKSMWNMFVRAGSGIGQNSKQTTRNMVSSNATLMLFDIRSNSCVRWNAITSGVSEYKTAINLELRNSVIRFLNGTDTNDNLTIIHNVFWNFFIPFVLALICLIYKLIKKEWFMVFLILAILARIPLVFVTAPAPYFMYYLSTYLCSYIISAIVIFEFIIKIFNKHLMLEKGEE